MWLALDAGGALGVVAVRLADSVPAFFFGLHGGVAADRWSRAADDRRRVVRAATLIPVAVAGLVGSLPLWGLVAARSCSRPRRATSRPRTARRSRRSSTARTSNRRTRSCTRRRRRFGRRLGARGGDAAVRPGEHVLRGRRGDVLRLGGAARAAPPGAGGQPRASPRACARASTHCARGVRCRRRWSCSASR